jgi:hypothetical protein
MAGATLPVGRSLRTGHWRLIAWFVALTVAAVLIATRTSPSSDPPAAGATAVVDDGASEAQQDALRQLRWIVSMADPVVTDATAGCLDAGPQCSSGAMLDTDTTALRAAALATSLGAASTPDGPRYVGDPGPRTAELAQRTARAATAATAALRQWLDSGCGSNIGGVPVVARPSECDGWTSTARERLRDLSDALAAWPQP